MDLPSGSRWSGSRWDTVRAVTASAVSSVLSLASSVRDDPSDLSLASSVFSSDGSDGSKRSSDHTVPTQQANVETLQQECQRCKDEEKAIKSRNKVIIFLAVVFLLLLTLDSVLLWFVIGPFKCDQTGSKHLQVSNTSKTTRYSNWSVTEECPQTQRHVRVYHDWYGQSFDALSFKQFGYTWTVFQRRVSGSVDFNRSWAYYAVYGFGSINDSHWISLIRIHNFCNKGVQCELIINMRYEDKPLNPAVKKDPSGCYHARYSNFSVGERVRDYFALRVGGYTGTAGDSLTNARYPSTNVNKMWFHTYDSDHTSSKCVARHLSGWWHNNCTMANLNGCWASCPSRQMGIYWKTLGAEPLDFVEMALRIKQ